MDSFNGNTRNDGGRSGQSKWSSGIAIERRLIETMI